MSLDTIDGPPTDKPPLDYHFEEDGHVPDHKLRRAAVAAGVAFTVALLLYYQPMLVAGLVAGLAMPFLMDAYDDRA